ncbi:Porin B precursor [Lacunisphaera limnophila]|uniref:Porin B n=1 Tax=Lacunisphaera limnophila TaxID=1838286 RepID=A0A1D8AUW5_9BACT|nr:carbohydrate porin [Lacunisphaera limnophila]AOS44694.1 Porin B precursor [Lacunisphaera limnophila]
MTAKFTLLLAALALSLLGPTTPGYAGSGIDLTLEAAAGIRGGAQRGESLQALALVYSGWESPRNSPEDIQWGGYVSALALSGKGPTERFLGDFFAASNMEGYRSVRLYSWWLEAKGQSWSLRGGALLADEEFAGTEGGGNFFNSAFGWPPFLSANTVNTGPAFFVATPGIRYEHTWGETAAWRVGLYDGDSFDSPTGDPAVTRHGLHYQVGGAQGWFLITEGTFAPAGGSTRYKAGAWFHTATFADVRDDATGQPYATSGNDPREYTSNHGAYAAIEHTLAGEAGAAGNVEIFARGGLSPANRNALGWAVDAGLGWTGPIPGRPDDVIALGLAHGRFSGAFADHARLTDPASPAPDFEQVIEASYTFIVNEHLSVQPDFQFIRHPGGSIAQKDACVFLLRLNASY